MRPVVTATGRPLGCPVARSLVQSPARLDGQRLDGWIYGSRVRLKVLLDSEAALINCNVTLGNHAGGRHYANSAHALTASRHNETRAEAR